MNRIKQSVGLLLLLFLALAAAPVLAQGPDYQIDQYTVAGGSGQLSGGDYSLDGTVGQAEANPMALSEGGYSLWPGFGQILTDNSNNGPAMLYLPLIVKNYTIAPDLIITEMTVTAQTLTLTLRNQGNAAVIDSFWVDVYFNPATVPYVNQPWNTIAPAGATWGVAIAIPAGDTLTLTVGDAWYFSQYSSSTFPTGATVYGYVDSVDYENTYGVVRESNEANNLFGPVISEASIAAPSNSGRTQSDQTGLPIR